MNKDSQRKGNDPRVGDLLRRVAELEKKVSEVQAPVVVDCALCDGTGYELDKKGLPLTDDNDWAIPCRVCKGAAKLKL